MDESEVNEHLNIEGYVLLPIVRKIRDEIVHGRLVESERKAVVKAVVRFRYKMDVIRSWERVTHVQP